MTQRHHQRWERITILWPGGGHDFVIEYDREEPSTPAGWLLISGLVVEPNRPEYRA